MFGFGVGVCKLGSGVGLGVASLDWGGGWPWPSALVEVFYVFSLVFLAVSCSRISPLDCIRRCFPASPVCRSLRVMLRSSSSVMLSVLLRASLLVSLPVSAVRGQQMRECVSV